MKKNNGYTYGRIVEQIILKIQTTFEGPTGSLVVDSIRNHTMHVFSEPKIETMTKTEAADKLLGTQRLLRKWEKDYEHY